MFNRHSSLFKTLSNTKIISAQISDEDPVRQRWQIHSLVQIYSYTLRKWFIGKIVTISNEGGNSEWLEVTYNNMSKQVTRNSADIKPFYQDDINKQIAELLTFGYIRFEIEKWIRNFIVPMDINAICLQYFFCTAEQKLLHKEIKLGNKEWDKGDKIQIFCDVDQQWYDGKVADIFYTSTHDEKLEQLECVWTKPNGEAMSKLFPRFSENVKPLQRYEREFCVYRGYVKPTTFLYPATSSARRNRKLLDLEETTEDDQYVDDDSNLLHVSRVSTKSMDNRMKCLKYDNRNSIMETMSDLSLELGKMFHSERINALCNELQRQLMDTKKKAYLHLV